MIDREEIHKSGNQGQQDQGHTSQKLRPDDLPVRQGLGDQHLNGTRAVLFGKATHRDRRNKEEENPRREDKEAVQTGINGIQYIEIALEHPKKQARNQQKHHDHHDAHQRTEEVAYFFFIQCVHFVLN